MTKTCPDTSFMCIDTTVIELRELNEKEKKVENFFGMQLSVVNYLKLKVKSKFLVL